MRLSGGKYGRRHLASPAGKQIRPTSDRVRQALFNILGPLHGERVLDLCAGAGTLGLEALSRGAESALFVDISPASLDIVALNIKNLEFASRARTLRRSLPQGLLSLGPVEGRFDLVFLDPPYGWKDLQTTVRLISEANLMNLLAILVVEHDRDDVVEPLVGPLKKVDRREYGRTVLSFFQYSTQ